MSKLEKKLCILALIFIALYLGAIFITLTSRDEKKTTTTKIESVHIKTGERIFVLAELLLPMSILAILVICLIIARKRRSKAIKLLDDDDVNGAILGGEDAEKE